MNTIPRITAVGVFDDRRHAHRAIDELCEKGFSPDQIGLIIPVLFVVVERLGGARRGAVQVLERGRIAVMSDPEGNEFCLIANPAV